MELHEAFGFAAAFGWALSSIFWIISTLVKFTAQRGDTIKAEDFTAYFAKTGWWNATAGMVSAISAALSAAALFTQPPPGL